MRKTTKGIGILAFLLLLTSMSLKAQQLPLYSQYMMNRFLINPAVAGAEGYTALSLTSREQWLGYSDSYDGSLGPITNCVTGEMRILKTSFRNKRRSIRSRVRRRRPSGRVGLGFSVYNDNNGKISRTGFQGTYAYHLYVRNVQFSMGMSGIFYQYRANLTAEDFYDPTGSGVANLNKLTTYIPDINIGFYASTQNWYAGVSSTQLMQSWVKFGNSTNTDFKLLRHYYAMGGYRYDIDRDFSIEPSAVMTITDRLSYTFDINVRAFYQKDYWLGFSYRTPRSLIMMLGMSYRQYYFGYAFDYDFSSISTINRYGTHEVVMGIRFGDNTRRYRWLQRF